MNKQISLFVSFWMLIGIHSATAESPLIKSGLPILGAKMMVKHADGIFSDLDHIRVNLTRKASEKTLSGMELWMDGSWLSFEIVHQESDPCGSIRYVGVQEKSHSQLTELTEYWEIQMADHQGFRGPLLSKKCRDIHAARWEIKIRHVAYPEEFVSEMDALGNPEAVITAMAATPAGIGIHRSGIRVNPGCQKQ